VPQNLISDVASTDVGSRIKFTFESSKIDILFD